MTEEQAIAIATEYLHRRAGPHPTFGIDACGFEMKGAKPARLRPNTWAVVYGIVILNDPGSVVDADMVIIVDAVSGEAKFLDELYG
jgi:hypothetical protein